MFLKKILWRKILTQISCLVFTLVAIAASAAASANRTTSANMVTANITTKPGCQRTCGSLTVPYPFGIGSKCSIHPSFNINCSTSFNPPKPFFGVGTLEIVDISERNVRTKNSVGRRCNNFSLAWLWISAGLRTFSATLNQFIVVGCNDYATITGTRGRIFTSGCISVCAEGENVTGESCSGIGCCHTDIPKGIHKFDVSLKPFNNESSFRKTCSYAFLGETEKFTFRGLNDFSDPKFRQRIADEVPVVFDWDVGNGTKCVEAQKITTTYACQGNTSCSDSDTASNGYHCNCLPGYEGNPYLSPGCTDIDECARMDNLCSHVCTNSLGSYICSCPKNHDGDGFKNGTGCISDESSKIALKTGLGTSFGFLFAFLSISLVYIFIRNRQVRHMRKEFFKQNGGYLLRQQLSSNHSDTQSPKIFTSNELQKATNNYSQARILGLGGYGTVYKGILSDNHVVAIKKSTMVDQSQIKQFINEIDILSGINHRNVVRLLGCCLEEKVPLLVYEFISNGTLFELIHKRTSWLTWETSIRIATEVANALSYLHSSVNTPIIHRDIKSANILIDDTYTAKISDFGVSRPVPLDQTRVTTLVLGTLGYLDPEYFHTSQLTEKSDVYSFGVVLAELLTREKPLCEDRKIEDRNLVMYLVRAMKEGRLLEIIHPQLIKEANMEHLISMADLVKRCVSVDSEDRPTMKEVANKLEKLKKNLKHPWIQESSQEKEGKSLLQEHMSSKDLYSTPTSNIHSNSTQSNSSGQYELQMELVGKKNQLR